MQQPLAFPTETCDTKENQGRATLENYQTYYDAAEAALANYTGEDDLDPSTIELVTDLLIQAVKVLPNWEYFQSLLEKSSSYVQTDLDELELNDYVGELELQLEEFGLV